MPRVNEPNPEEGDRSNMTDICLEEASTSQGTADEDDELQTVAVEQQWSPSDKSLAQLPDILRLPFQLQGRLHISSKRIVLCKKHTFIGSSIELIYSTRGSRTPAIQHERNFYTPLRLAALLPSSFSFPLPLTM
jgi:hypothetical protein